MTFTAGSLLTEDFTLIDGASSPITGATLGAELSILVSADPHGQPFAGGVTITEIGSGLYRVGYQTAASSPAGHYVLLVRYNDVNTQTFEIEWDLAASAVSAVTPLVTSANGVTRKELRRAVYRLLGDMVLLTATQDSDGSSFIDEDNIVQGAGNYAARQLYVTSSNAGNQYQARRVSGNAGSTLQLSRALPEVVLTGDEAELVNTYGQGFRIEDVHAAIEEAIAALRPMVPIQYTYPDAFAETERALAIPDEFATVDRVEWRNPVYTSSSWTQLQRAQALGEQGWFVDAATRELYIGNTSAFQLRDATIRIAGMQRVAMPANDTDLVPVNREYVRYKVAGELLTRPIGQDASIAGDRMRIGLTYLDEAEKLRSKTIARPRAGRTVLP